MPTSAKLPEIRKEAFTKARETLGLNTKELAGMACLSVRQIEQIENGETAGRRRSHAGGRAQCGGEEKIQLRKTRLREIA